jgi:2-polyprenyl-3-methyl-5-hydroxy-6-metoxy-1,4-benzoquinol methylase
MICKVCSYKTNKKFKANILKKHEIHFYECSNCGFVQTEAPYWLEEAYALSMNLGDTGQMLRNEKCVKVTAALISTFLNPNGRFLDFAAGYGIFVRCMRDKGYDFYWDDLYTENLLAMGFEAPTDVEKYDLITVFECFEHFVDPLAEIEKLFQKTDHILFTTTLIPIPTPEPDKWWYYGLDHGQHVAFYRKKSLELIARKFGAAFHSRFGFHFFTKKKINKTIFKLVVTLAMKEYGTLFFKKRPSLTDKDSLLLVQKNKERLDALQ